RNMVLHGRWKKMVRRHRLLSMVVAVVAMALATAVPAATAAPSGKDKLGSAIETRLNRLGDATTAMTDPGYFYRNPILPQRAFYTDAGCGQAFRFVVDVYRTATQAAAMYDYYYQHVVNIGGNF